MALVDEHINPWAHVLLFFITIRDLKAEWGQSGEGVK